MEVLTSLLSWVTAYLLVAWALPCLPGEWVSFCVPGTIEVDGVCVCELSLAEGIRYYQRCIQLWVMITESGNSLLVKS